MEDMMKFEQLEAAEEFDSGWFAVGGVLAFGIVFTAFLLFT